MGESLLSFGKFGSFHPTKIEDSEGEADYLSLPSPAGIG
jgi:hypothetical protein